ncbi:MAG: hypothetical protein RSC08_07890, partial [Oscillospiraceae bacterium]
NSAQDGYPLNLTTEELKGTFNVETGQEEPDSAAGQKPNGIPKGLTLQHLTTLLPGRNTMMVHEPVISGEHRYVAVDILAKDELEANMLVWYDHGLPNHPTGKLNTMKDANGVPITIPKEDGEYLPV